MLDPVIVVALLSLLGSAASLVFGYVQASRKMNADAASDYMGIIGKDLSDLRDRLDALESYVGELEGHVDELHAMMITAGLKPPPRPRRPRRLP